MDLKDFIKETISGIVEATLELQMLHEEKGVIVNPPVSTKERGLYEHENPGHRFRRVETVEFDVAMTAASETQGSGKAGLRILSAEAGIDGRHSRNNEEVSRVRFSIPIVLSPAMVESKNKSASDQALEEQRLKAKEADGRRRNDEWMARR